MNHKTLKITFALLLASMRMAEAQDMRNLTIALAVEAPEKKIQEAFSEGLAKHLRSAHNISIVRVNESPDIVVRVSVEPILQDGKLSAFSLAGSVESHLDEKVATEVYKEMPRDQPQANAFIDFMKYLAEGNVLPVATFHEVGGRNALESVHSQIDEGVERIQKQQAKTLSALERLMQIVTRDATPSRLNRPRMRFQ